MLVCAYLLVSSVGLLAYFLVCSCLLACYCLVASFFSKLLSDLLLSILASLVSKLLPADLLLTTDLS